MIAEELITKITNAKHYSEIFASIPNYKKDFKKYSSLIHPDKCTVAGAADAMAKLSDFVSRLESQKFQDESGPFTIKDNLVSFSEDSTDFPHKSILNKYFLQREIPRKFEKIYTERTIQLGFDDDGKYFGIAPERMILLEGLELSELHVRWVFSRLLEFISPLIQGNVVHGGLTPTSVGILPESHGIQIISFYHCNSVFQPAKTVSGQYYHWYPPSMIKTKEIPADLDIQFARKIAFYLLGDQTGLGLRLKKEMPDSKFVSYLHNLNLKDSEIYLNYRKFLSANYKSEFIPLNL